MDGTGTSTLSRPTHRILGFLRRDMRGCKTPARSRAYETFVRPTLECGAAVWDPHTTGQVKQVAKVQHREDRFATRNYYDRTPGSITSMIMNLKWESLDTRRVKLRIMLLYKIQHQIVAIPADLYITASDSRTRGQHTFRVPPSLKDVHLYITPFFPTTIRDWNRIPSQEEFRAQLSRLTPTQLGI